jgi:predicted MFS family arabinose efflux permease
MLSGDNEGAPAERYMDPLMNAEPSTRPPGFLEVLRRPGIRSLALSRASSKLAMATLSYGAMVYLATQGGTQLQISLLGATTYLSAVLFGVQGGTLADSMSKRLAIASGYLAIAAFMIVLPLLFGTGVAELLILMFVSSALMQVISPSLKSAVALVSSPPELATVSASVSVVGSIASAAGSSFLAPLLIKTTGIDVLLFVVAAISVYGAVRTLKLPDTETSAPFRAAVRRVDWRPTSLSVRATARWLVDNRAVSALILVGAVVVAIFEAFNTLVPVYVRDVLEADPTDAIYIFAPAGIGFLIGTFLTPLLISRIGARRLAVLAAGMMAVSMMLFGFIDIVAPVLAPFSPLRLLGWLFSVEISAKVLAASVIAVPANFGSTAAGASIQTYINAKVAIERQGQTFGLQEVQENLVTLVLVIVLGGLSAVIGPRAVFVLAPVVAFLLVVSLIRYSYRVMEHQALTRREAFSRLVGEDDPVAAETCGQE